MRTELPGPVLHEKVIVAERTFLIVRPDDATAIPNLDAPATVPYWAELWPGARMLARAVMTETWSSTVPKQAALEIGCGLGLVGIAALAAGLKVTFTDRDPLALQFAAVNAQLNGFDDFDTMLLDWNAPPADLKAEVILGSELVYVPEHASQVSCFIQQVLTPNGQCLIADLDRVPAHKLTDALTAAGLAFTTQIVRAGEPGGRRSKGTLYRIRHADPY